MKTQLQNSVTRLHHRLLLIAIVLSILMLLQITFSHAQTTTQPAQIAWGSYFEDPSHPEFKWSKEDMGEKIYYFENNIYMVGRTKSDTDAFVNCSGTAASGNGDAFVASYNPVCNKYNWVSYFGGPTATDYAYCAALDKVNGTSWIYIAGEVNAQKKQGLLTAQSCVSSGCTSVFQTKAADKWDGFIAKYNANTGQLVRWTYFGGKARDQILGIAVDTITHNVYFTGYTESPSFLTYSNYNFTPYKSDVSGSGDMFIGCLDSCLNSLQYFTYYGGNNSDRGHEIEILYTSPNQFFTTQYLVLSGTTQSVSGIVPASSENYFDNTFGAGADGNSPDAFMLIWDVAHLSNDPDWSTYFGGSSADRGRGISISSNNDIYWTGQTQSDPDNDHFIPTADAYQSQRNGGIDCFVAKFHVSSMLPMIVNLDLFTYFGGEKNDYAKSIRAFHTNDESNGADSVAVTGLTYSADLPIKDSTSLFLSKDINGNGNELKRDAFIAVLTKNPDDEAAKQRLSSFTYLGGENDETDIKQNDVLVQKSYNPGLAVGPNGSLFIIYSTKGKKTKKNGNIPTEYNAFHCPDGGCNNSAIFQPDAYFAQVDPFTQHFIPDDCAGKSEASTMNSELNEQDAIRFYPVPFSSSTQLQIKVSEEKNGEVIIYDLFGRVIMEKNLSLHAGENNITFDFLNFAAGVYLSRIKLGSDYHEVKITKE